MIESHVPLMDVLVDGKAERWVPVMQIGSDPRSMVGLSETGDWLVSDSRTCSRLKSAATGVALLPVLEDSPAAFLARLRSAAAELGFPASIADGFPITLAMDAALAGRSAHWAELALAWVGAVPMTDYSRELVLELSESSWAPPATRQLALQKLRELPAE